MGMEMPECYNEEEASLNKDQWQHILILMSIFGLDLNKAFALIKRLQYSGDSGVNMKARSKTLRVAKRELYHQLKSRSEFLSHWSFYR